MALQDIMQAPTCKSIISKHYADNDMRNIGDETCKTMGESLVTETVSQSILPSPMSTRPNPSEGWNGSQQSFPMHFANQARQFDNTSNSPHTPGQLSRLLSTCVGNLPNLDRMHYRSRTEMETRNIVPWTDFQDCMVLLPQ
jgi:Tfp pilus assembly protein PilV